MPEQNTNHDIAERSADSAKTASDGFMQALSVSSDGNVYLPVSQKVTFIESGIAESPWPPKVRDAVIQTDTPTTRLQKYLAFLVSFLVLCIGCLIIHQRASFRITDIPDTELLVSEFPALTDQSDRVLYKKSLKLAENGNYSDSFRMLFSEACKISVKRQKSRYLLCARCFESYSKIISIPWTMRSELPFVQEALKNLMESEPDRYQWFMYHADALCRDFYDFENVWSVIGKTHRYADKSQFTRDIMTLHENIVLLNQAEKLADRGQKEKIRDSLRCKRAKLLISAWLLAGSGGDKASLPDDEKDPGVQFREEALQIAMLDRYRDVREFLKMRGFIAETILKQDSILNGYYWNGRARFAKRWLEQEINEVNEKLNSNSDRRE